MFFSFFTLLWNITSLLLYFLLFSKFLELPPVLNDNFCCMLYKWRSFSFFITEHIIINYYILLLLIIIVTIAVNYYYYHSLFITIIFWQSFVFFLFAHQNLPIMPVLTFIFSIGSCAYLHFILLISAFLMCIWFVYACVIYRWMKLKLCIVINWAFLFFLMLNYN